MILFFDTSALVKYFHVEEGTEQVTAFRLLAEDGWHFVAADEVLCHVIQLDGFNVINPCYNSF